jgi:hypothetical protein
MNPYSCFFFGFYRVMQRTAYRDIAGYMSCVSFSMFLSLNVVVLSKLVGYDLLKHGSSWIPASIIFATILAINLVLFHSRGPYKRIVVERTNSRCLYITLLYVSASVVALVMS